MKSPHRKVFCLRFLWIVPAFVFLGLTTGMAQVGLEQQLQDPDPKIRERAARGLGNEGNPAAVPALAAIVQDSDEKVRMAVVRGLIRLGSPASLPPLGLAVRDGIPEIRYLAIDGLVNYYLPGYVDTGFGGFFRSVSKRVGGLFSDVDTVVVDADIKVDGAVVQTLRQALTGAPDMNTRSRAARALGILRAQETVEDLVQAAFGNDVTLIEEVLRALQKIKDPSVGPRISFLLNYPQEHIQEKAAETVGLLRTQEAIPELQRLLQNSSSKVVRATALEALAFMPTTETAPLFTQYLEDREKSLRAAAALGLGRLKNAAYRDALEQAWQKEKDKSVGLALAFALVANGKMEALDELVSNLSSRVRQGEARPYLIELAREGAVREALYPQLHHRDAEIRQNLCQVFAASGDSTSLSYLETLLRDRNSDVVLEATRAIRILRSRGM
ncbi:MAG: HEAT repeat domain-containing protein [Acidobacteria bacterium]|nr:HEAT repeat domain-containing protein [Acidobacteriota bacterium]